MQFRYLYNLINYLNLLYTNNHCLNYIIYHTVATKTSKRQDKHFFQTSENYLNRVSQVFYTMLSKKSSSKSLSDL